jgi:hypothetical protein
VLDAGVSAQRPAPLIAAPVDVPTPACPNCGSPHTAAFCADCGERQPSRHDYSVRGMALDAFHDFTSLDGRLIRSVVALLAKPGFLTREWFAGRRGRYVKPFSLFVVLNLVFFLVQPHTHLLRYDYNEYVGGDGDAVHRRQLLVAAKQKQLAASPTAFAARFDAALQDQKKSLLIVCIPVFACLLALTYVGADRYFAEHLVFSVHAYTFFLIFATLVTPIYRVLFGVLGPLGVTRETRQMLGGQTALIAVMAVVLGGYFALALRRVYGDRWRTALPRALVLVAVQQFLIVVYHDVLFYTTLYSL